MRKILLLDKPVRVVDEYIDKYRDFYVQMYTDTGLWNEDQLVESYCLQASLRKQKIHALLHQNLSPDIIIGYHIEKGLHIPWRSKDIWIKWQDDGETRIIIDIKIQ